MGGITYIIYTDTETAITKDIEAAHTLTLQLIEQGIDATYEPLKEDK